MGEGTAMTPTLGSDTSQGDPEHWRRLRATHIWATSGSRYLAARSGGGG